MSSRKRITSALSLILLTALLVSCHTSKKLSTFRIATFPTEDSQEQLLHLQPLADYLTNSMSVRVEFMVTTDYTASIEALRAGHVEMAWLGPFSYAMASKLANVTPILGGIRKDTGDIYYNSVIIVRRDSGINSLDDLRGKTFAFVDPASTSGYLFPLAKLLEEGINPETDFKSVIFAGSHSAVELALANNQVDGIADSLPSFNLMVENGKMNRDDFIILWTSDAIPPSPLVVRNDVDPNLVGKFTEAMLHAPPDIVAAEGQIAGYRPVSDKDYDIVREVMKKVGVRGDQ